MKLGTGAGKVLVCCGLGLAVAAFPDAVRGLRVIEVVPEGHSWTVRIVNDRDAPLMVTRIVPTCDCVHVADSGHFLWEPRGSRQVRLSLVHDKSLTKAIALLVVYHGGVVRVPLELT